MKRDIEYYINRAKRAAGITSDRELGRLMGWSVSVVSQFRRGISYPSDDNMVRLAEAGQEDPREALAVLAASRTRGRAKQLWEEIARKVSSEARSVEPKRLEHA